MSASEAEEEVPSLSFAALLEQEGDFVAGREIAALKLDCEGCEWEIWEQIPWAKVYTLLLPPVPPLQRILVRFRPAWWSSST